MAEPNQFDIVGTLITQKGLTGENIALQIFSYMNISTFISCRSVSKIWKHFLITQRKLKSICMEELRKTASYLRCLDQAWLKCDQISAQQSLRWFHFPGTPLPAYGPNLDNLAALPTWENLFYAIDENGTTEDIIEVYSKIQCIAAFNNYIDFWCKACDLSCYHYRASKKYPFENSEIFEDSYIGEELQKEIMKFVKEQKQQKYPLDKSKWKKSIQELQCKIPKPSFGGLQVEVKYCWAVGPFTASQLISDIAGQIQKKFVLKLRRIVKNFQEQDVEPLMSYFAEIQLSSV